MVTILSVNIGAPQPLIANNKVMQSGIFKRPVAGPVPVQRAGLAGDTIIHGLEGGERAVYAYPSEHYALWREEFPEMELPFGTLAENLTTEGIFDEQVHIGDRYQVGSALLTVTQPRMPCYKLAARLNRPDIIQRMIAVKRHGFFCSVTKEGSVNVGDTLQLVHREPESITILEAAALYTGRDRNPELLERALVQAALPKKWKDKLAERVPA